MNAFPNTSRGAQYSPKKIPHKIPRANPIRISVDKLGRNFFFVSAVITASSQDVRFES
jgi:hypothetical protein